MTPVKFRQYREMREGLLCPFCLRVFPRLEDYHRHVANGHATPAGTFDPASLEMMDGE